MHFSFEFKRQEKKEVEKNVKEKIGHMPKKQRFDPFLWRKKKQIE